MDKEKRKEFYAKHIIVDFDDTLCIHPEDKSNIANGLPNIDLINKLNKLFDEGFTIEIYTARGHISAKNRKEAEHKYRQVIEDWLQNYFVKYHSLSFQKPFGVIYIDDKSVRPDELELIDNLTKDIV